MAKRKTAEGAYRFWIHFDYPQSLIDLGGGSDSAIGRVLNKFERICFIAGYRAGLKAKRQPVEDER